MPRWFDRAEEEIANDHDEGLIDDKEYRERMRDLRDELREDAQEASERAYRGMMDY